MSVCKVVDGEHDINNKKASVHKLCDAFEELNRLQNEHKERIKLCDEDIEKYKKFKDDYLHLQKRITSLPDKTTHEVMVPIGSLAFMPGRLIHTNEITVLLGDNWFVERSGKQATGIVSRRVRDVDEKLQSMENVRRLHENWLKEAEELSQGNAGEQVEIIEGPFDEQEAQKSKEETRRKLKEYNKKLKEDKTKKKTKESNKENTNRSKQLNNKETGLDMSKVNVDINIESSNKPVNNSEDRSHENLMNRLDQLYLQEQTNRELESDNDIEDVDEIDISNDQVGAIKLDVEEPESEDLTEESEYLTEESTDEESEYYENKEETLNEQSRLKRRVSWADENPQYVTIIPDNDSEDIFKIQYIPSKLFNVDGESHSINLTKDSNKSGCVNINSPSDLYKAFSIASSIPLSASHEAVVASLDMDSSPRGILKKLPNRSLQTQNVLTDDLGRQYSSECLEAVIEDSGDIIARPPTPPRYSNQVQSQVLLENSEDAHLLQPAFKYSVVARDDQNENQTGSVKNTAMSNDSSNSEPKKVSKFKASRINKT